MLRSALALLFLTVTIPAAWWPDDRSAAKQSKTTSVLGCMAGMVHPLPLKLSIVDA
ncbi:MAG TPA: hypothetical protein VM779_14495 [Thermoanaerobaculia bacterium]|nr:hypothetical protein [Thermoanaerobaculia bacterium]